MHDPASAIIHCDLVLNNTNKHEQNNTKNIDRLGTLSNRAKKHIPEIISIEKVFNSETHKISRNIWVRKMRQTKHNEDIHSLKITNKGIVVKTMK